MSNPFDQFDQVEDEQGLVGAGLPEPDPGADKNPFDQFDRTLEKPVDGIQATDLTKAAAAGVGSTAAGAGWLSSRADMNLLGMPEGAPTVGDALQLAGTKLRDFWHERMSEGAKANLQKEFLKSDDKDAALWNVLSGDWENVSRGDAGWRTAALGASESLPATFSGMGLGAFLAQKLSLVPYIGPKLAAAMGYGLGEGIVASPMAGQAAEEQVSRMEHEQLMLHPEYVAAMEASDGDQAKAKDLVRRAAGNDAAALTALTTTILSAPAGAFMDDLFLGKLQPGSRGRAIAQGAVGEATQELLQSGMEALNTNVALAKNADFHRDIFQGVLEDAIAGAASGAPMGAGFGAFAPIETPPPEDPRAETERRAREDAASLGGDALAQELAAADALDAYDRNVKFERQVIPTPPEAPLDAARPEDALSVDYEETAPMGLEPLEFGGPELDAARDAMGVDFDRTGQLAAGVEREIGDYLIAAVERDAARRREPPKYPMPEGYGDRRLGRDEFRDHLHKMADELVEGGNVAYIRDEQGNITGRTPSINPDWYKNLSDEMKLPVVAAKHAVRKALSGQKLGPKQARFVTAMMDEISGERYANRYETARRELEEARLARRAFDPDRPGKPLETEEDWEALFRHPMDTYVTPEGEAMEGDQAKLSDKFEEAIEVGVDTSILDAIVDRYDDPDMIRTAADLQELIDEAAQQLDGQAEEGARVLNYWEHGKVKSVNITIRDDGFITTIDGASVDPVPVEDYSTADAPAVISDQPLTEEEYINEAARPEAQETEPDAADTKSVAPEPGPRGPQAGEAAPFYIEIRGERYPVDGIEDARLKFIEARDQLLDQGVGGGRELGSRFPILATDTGKAVAAISYNGKVIKAEDADDAPAIEGEIEGPPGRPTPREAAEAVVDDLAEQLLEQGRSYTNFTAADGTSWTLRTEGGSMAGKGAQLHKMGAGPADPKESFTDRESLLSRIEEIQSGVLEGETDEEGAAPPEEEPLFGLSPATGTTPTFEGFLNFAITSRIGAKDRLDEAIAEGKEDKDLLQAAIPSGPHGVSFNTPGGGYFRAEIVFKRDKYDVKVWTDRDADPLVYGKAEAGAILRQMQQDGVFQQDVERQEPSQQERQIQGLVAGLPEGYPKPNENGVFTSDVIETIEYDAPKSHRTKVSINVVEYAPGRWASSLNYANKTGGFSGLPGIIERPHSPHFDTRQDAINYEARRLLDHNVRNGETDREANRLNKWLDKQIVDKEGMISESARDVLAAHREKGAYTEFTTVSGETMALSSRDGKMHLMQPGQAEPIFSTSNEMDMLVELSELSAEAVIEGAGPAEDVAAAAEVVDRRKKREAKAEKPKIKKGAKFYLTSFFEPLKGKEINNIAKRNEWGSKMLPLLNFANAPAAREAAEAAGLQPVDNPEVAAAFSAYRDRGWRKHGPHKTLDLWSQGMHHVALIESDSGALILQRWPADTVAKESEKGQQGLSLRGETAGDQVQAFPYASGMSRPGDFDAALKSGVGVGVDVNELSANMIDKIVEAALAGKQIFIDSGAYALYRAAERAGIEAEVIDADAVISRYEEIVGRVRAQDKRATANLLLVAPDVVGDQAATLELLEQYADRLIEIGGGYSGQAEIIYPFQRGELSMRDLRDRILDIINPDKEDDNRYLGDIVVGIPSNVEAMRPHELDNLLDVRRADQPDRIHILGAVREKAIASRMEAIKRLYKDDIPGVTADANVLRAKVNELAGRNRPDAVEQIVRDVAPIQWQAPGAEEKPPAAPFDAKQWQRERDERIEASKAAGNQHLDDIEPYVETMRGLDIYNVHDPKERGTVKTVANTGEVVVGWADEYAADKNLATEEQEEGRRIWADTWLAPTDLRDYVVGTPEAAPSEEEQPELPGVPEPTPQQDIMSQLVNTERSQEEVPADIDGGLFSRVQTPDLFEGAPKELSDISIIDRFEGPEGPVLVSQKADKALADIDARIDQAKALVACVRSA